MQYSIQFNTTYDSSPRFLTTKASQHATSLGSSARLPFVEFVEWVQIVMHRPAENHWVLSCAPLCSSMACRRLQWASYPSYNL